jgi:hypothetical protein
MSNKINLSLRETVMVLSALALTAVVLSLVAGAANNLSSSVIIFIKLLRRASVC